ncbi:MAG: ABC transporter substrate-binding protein, partial [Pelolinea sp.]|nr:ABC transporter substrate-binding protein [Pelolinea sp.]
SQAAQEVLQAVYDGPIDILNDGQVEPIILKRMPSLTDGSAFLTPVSVFAGDEVVDTFGDLVSLQAGTRVFPSGCTSPSCAIAWDGVTELQVNQITATYELLDGLKWSDGQLISAPDSVYAFQVASDPAAPISKRVIDQTGSYTTVDDTTIEWVGKPGLVTDTFESYFWAPMPEHVWGKYSVDELLEAEEVNRNPLGWGAYVVEEWQPGAYIRLRKNPYYFRTDEGLPKTDFINFKFLQNANPETIRLSVGSECDIVSSTALDLQDMIYLSNTEPDPEFIIQKEGSSHVEMLAIGITPASYDDYYYPYGVDRPDIFGDERVRQALAYCIDRDAINNELLGGIADINNALFASDNFLLSGLNMTMYAHDPAGGISLLEQVGWRDHDLNPDTPMTAANVANVPPGTVFEVELLLSESSLRADIAREISTGLANCGIKVNVTQLPASELYQPGPDGRIFGRQFDLALLSWQTDDRFNCEWFMTGEIPKDANYWLGEKTGGANYYGFSDGTYDAACVASQQSGLDHGAALQADQQNIQLLNQRLPFITIYHQSKIHLVKKGIEGFENFSDLD